MGLIETKLAGRGVPRDFKISPDDMMRQHIKLNLAFDNLTLRDIPTDPAHQTVSQQNIETWTAATSPIRAIGQVTLGEGSVNVAIVGLLATDLPFITVMSINGSDVSATARILPLCTAGNLTITAYKADGTYNENDGSTINYFIIPSS